MENSGLTDIIGRATIGIQTAKKDSAKKIVKEDEMEHQQSIDENPIDLPE